MTPHMSQTFFDGSAAWKIYPGGRWKVYTMNGHGYECDAQRFVDDQNRFIGDFHRESVTKVRREGRP